MQLVGQLLMQFNTSTPWEEKIGLANQGFDEFGKHPSNSWPA
jgi:hypothetical protein